MAKNDWGQGVPSLAFFAALLLGLAVAVYCVWVAAMDAASWALDAFLRLPDTSQSAAAAAAVTLMLGAVLFAFRLQPSGVVRAF